MILQSRYLFLSGVIAFVFTAFVPSQSEAQTKLTGFIRNYNAVQTLSSHELLIGRNRLRLGYEQTLSSGSFFITNDVQNLYSYAIDSLHYQLRESYLEFYFKQSDLRIGRQIISWGRTDGAFITDVVSPVDLSEFLTQNPADLRFGIDALSYYHYFGSNYLQLVVNPVFNPNTTPAPGSRWFPRSFLGGNIPVQFERFEQQALLKNAQLGGRFALRSSLDYDMDLILLYWHYPNPGYSKEFLVFPDVRGELQLTETFTRSLVLMYSGVVQLNSRLLLKSEAAFYTRRSFDYLTNELRSINLSNPSRDEQLRLLQIFNGNSDGFLKQRPWFVGMAGIEYDLNDWTIGAQLIDEFIVDHDDQILQKKHFTYATLLLQKKIARDKLEFRGFGRYNFSGEDFWIHPELTYSGIDNFELSAGTQLFGGPEPEQFYGHLSFNSYSKNSFAYLKVTAYF